MLVDEAQFQHLVDMYKSEMHCQILLVVVENSVWEHHEFDDLEPLCVLPADTEPIVMAGYTQMQPDPSHPNDPEPQFDPPMQPEPLQPHPATNQSKGVDEQIPDIFDNEEEYVGLHDEHIYSSIAPAQPSMNAQTDSPSSMPTNDANENAAAEGAIPPEVEVNDADPNEIRVLHDPENPRIEKGALFPDIIAFRKAVRHHAVKTGFEFAPGIKTDPTRFIARCKHPGCPWRIHASRLHDQKTIQVHTT